MGKSKADALAVNVKALNLIDAAGEDGLSVKELAAALGCPDSTAAMIVRRLWESGDVGRLPARKTGGRRGWRYVADDGERVETVKIPPPPKPRPAHNRVPDPPRDDLDAAITRVREQKLALYEQCLAAGLDVLHPKEGRAESYYLEMLESGASRLPVNPDEEPVCAWDSIMRPTEERKLRGRTSKDGSPRRGVVRGRRA